MEMNFFPEKENTDRKKKKKTFLPYIPLHFSGLHSVLFVPLSLISKDNFYLLYVKGHILTKEFLIKNTSLVT